VEAINSYDIKKLFLDSSKAVIEVDDEAYRNVILTFSQDLLKSRLQKLARMGSSIARQELRATKVTDDIRQANTITVDFQNFGSRDEAIAWLVKA
jgi:hypothetical protein